MPREKANINIIGLSIWILCVMLSQNDKFKTVAKYRATKQINVDDFILILFIFNLFSCWYIGKIKTLI